ncbi:Uncharacterized protein TCM_003262 [Theobroma cacao]|uniref:Uncharacterized protein n=1 Tax=Theobroma cacao TaxID=3641 RepID=A0A061DNV3_THECC|nr:Uncharacterized protein TCM_003262 [Theobroma cacao]
MCLKVLPLGELAGVHVKSFKVRPTKAWSSLRSDTVSEQLLDELVWCIACMWDWPAPFADGHSAYASPSDAQPSTTRLCGAFSV